MKKTLKKKTKASGQAQNRTGDTRIFNPQVKPVKSKTKATKKKAPTANVRRAAGCVDLAIELLTTESVARFILDDLRSLSEELRGAA